MTHVDLTLTRDNIFLWGEQTFQGSNSLPDIPECVDWSLGVPQLNDLGLMQAEQRFHGLLSHVRHHLLVNQGN